MTFLGRGSSHAVQRQVIRGAFTTAISEPVIPAQAGIHTIAMQ
jgi:hypothetical protein